jgi:Legionella pneumophila major outer membrane protein precursor
MPANSGDKHGGAAMPTSILVRKRGALSMRSFPQSRVGLILVGVAFFGARAMAQVPAGNQPAPASVQATADILSSLPRPPDAPRSLFSPMTPEGPPHAIVPDRYFEEDPLLDLPQLPALGWFAGAEASFVGPHVKNELKNDVAFAGRIEKDTIALQSAPLDWTVSPRFEVGYRLPSGFGEFSLGYNFLTTQGSESSGLSTGPASLSSRLDINTFDFDYATREVSLGDNWQMKWRIGGRLAFLYFDSQAYQAFAEPGAPEYVLAQRTTNYYAGFGPHAGLDLTRHLRGTGLSFVGRADFATLLGRVHQGFLEASSITPPNSPFSTSELHVSGSQDVPMATAEAGVGWQPPAYPFAQFFLGYHLDYWWNAGRLSTSESRGQVSDEGVTLRAEFVF